ncbi:MAG: DUF3465 domain-containing protein [Steroidobacteraceae bacterium]
MKKALTLLLVLIAAYLTYSQQHASQPDRVSAPTASEQPSVAVAEASTTGTAAIEHAFREQRSNVQVELQGTVSKLLKEDSNGSRHQRFIVSLPSGHTVLVAHNIDLAERVADLQSGDAVIIHGEYEWNPQGGVIHWTHRDPAGRHESGWIRHRDRIYQ